MPKEYLVNPSERRRQEKHGGDTAAVRVGWQRDTEVQIATVLLPGGEWGEEPNVGQFVDLDRYTLNRLIRVLRRARDQAYGRDE
jgi:hypothetical protein